MHWLLQQYSYVEWQFNLWVYDPMNQYQNMYKEPNIYENAVRVNSVY